LTPLPRAFTFRSPHDDDAPLPAGVAKGDPRLSSAETGKILSEKLVDVTARFIAHFASRIPAKRN
jgi:creatinine amidohydrolase